ncbi:MAG: hypothetical protein L6R45_33600 [Anaerolineae bacterium]|nr:hypothetical protein [Anaerolineae bacterium]
MNEELCFRVTVRNEQGRVILNWVKPWLGSLTVTYLSGKIIIKRESFFVRQIYLPGEKESVEIGSW